MKSKTGTPLRARLRFRPLSALVMTIVWVILWGSFSPFIVLSGLLTAYLIGIVFPLPPIHWSGRLHPFGFIHLIARLLYDLTVSSVRMLQLALARKIDLNQGIVRIELLSDDDLYQVQVAEMISLVPGTVVVEVVRHPRRLYLHCLDLIDDDAVDGIQVMARGVESRVLRAFGSKAEISAFDAALAAGEPPPDLLTAQEEWETEES